jgi:hypothetical protein
MDQPSSVSTEDVSHATELTERQLLLKAHEISCETLRLFCTHYNERLPLEGLGGARISILIATAVKAINTSHAVCRLCAERPYFEEMNVVTRSLIESIVNGVFIQFATDEEVQSFMHFDSISLAKAIRIAEGIAPEAVGVLSEKLRQEFSVQTSVGRAWTSSQKETGSTRVWACQYFPLSARFYFRRAMPTSMVATALWKRTCQPRVAKFSSSTWIFKRTALSII